LSLHHWFSKKAADGIQGKNGLFDYLRMTKKYWNDPLAVN